MSDRRAICELCSQPFRVPSHTAGRFCSRQCYYAAEQAMTAARRWAEAALRERAAADRVAAQRAGAAAVVPEPIPEDRAIALLIRDEMVAALAAAKEALG